MTGARYGLRFLHAIDASAADSIAMAVARRMEVGVAIEVVNVAASAGHVGTEDHAVTGVITENPGAAAQRPQLPAAAYFFAVAACSRWSISIGNGKMIVEFFSAAISVNVCR